MDVVVVVVGGGLGLARAGGSRAPGAAGGAPSIVRRVCVVEVTKMYR